MTKQSVRDALDRTGFIYADVGDVRITAHGPRSPGGEVGRKTLVSVRCGADTLESKKCHSNAQASSVFIKLADKYRPDDE